jgi:hypothetical protein
MLAPEDIRQLVNNSLIMYKGEPYFVYDTDGSEVYMISLDKVKKEVEFVLDDFKPVPRIGFVNDPIRGSIYFTRETRRVYSLGSTTSNTFWCSIGSEHPRAFLQLPQMKDAIFNNYPTLFKAWSFIKDHPHINGWAFDKQFAITHDRNIYYKNKFAGVVPKGYVRKKNIVWNKGFEFCEFLMEMDYEKTVPAFGS